MLAIYDRATHQKKAVLENAFNIVETRKLNNVSELTFSLPAGDYKEREIEPFCFVEWEGDEVYYRLLDSEDVFADGVPITNYICEHVVATLIDDVMFGSVQYDNLTTRENLENVLDRQSIKHWRLGDCEFSRLFSYNWSNENLIAAAFSIPNRFDVPYIWVFDTSHYPWTVHLRILDDTVNPQYYIRPERNLVSATKTSKGSDICTRLYALGYGEGVNQLTFAEINDGKPYIDASPEAIEKYGLVTRIWEDLRFEIPENLLQRARVLLNGLSKPYESWIVGVADLDKLTSEDIDRPEPGKIVQYGDLKTYIIEWERHLDAVGMDQIKIANAPEDIAGSIADLADRQRINSVYAQGATCLYALNFADNADATHPATLRFFVPQEAKQINKVVLTWKLERFRAYETGAAYAGGTSQATGGGGQSTQTSATGGGGSTTSGASSKKTSDTSPIEVTDAKTSTVSSHNHTYEQIASVLHSHGMDHTHSTSAPSHSHSVSIPSHTHSVDIPSHTHAITYGIYEGPTASFVTLRVDGKNIPLETGQYEIDIATMLGTDGGGRITRGTFHTIELVPNSQTRIVAALSAQIFIQSAGGGNY